MYYILIKKRNTMSMAKRYFGPENNQKICLQATNNIILIRYGSFVHFDKKLQCLKYIFFKFDLRWKFMQICSPCSRLPRPGR